MPDRRMPDRPMPDRRTHKCRPPDRRTPDHRMIDAHHRVWRLERGDYAGLTPAVGPIHRDFGLDDLVSPTTTGCRATTRARHLA